MNSGISDSDSGQNTKMAGLSQNQCPVYRGMTVRVMPESVSGLLRNMHRKAPPSFGRKKMIGSREVWAHFGHIDKSTKYGFRMET